MKKRINAQVEVPIDELELSCKAANAMRNMGIETVNQLLTIKRSKLIRQKNVGRKTICEIEGELAFFGLSLPEDEPHKEIKAHCGNLALARRKLQNMYVAKKILAEKIKTLGNFIDKESARSKKKKEGLDLAAKYPQVRRMAMAGMKETEIQVLIYRHLHKLSLRKTGEIMGKGGERIRQIEARAFRRLRMTHFQYCRPEVHNLGICHVVYGECTCEGIEEK